MYQLLLILLYNVYSLSAQDTCSALQSYIRIESVNALFPASTLLSAHALFPPEAYAVPLTSIVPFTSATDICDLGLTNDAAIAGKIVLLMAPSSQCAVQQQVLILQERGAVAVIVASFDELVSSMAGSSTVNTTIPARQIRYSDADLIVRTIQVGEDIRAEFSCFDTEYPPVICALDLGGNVWYMDGEYQLQANFSVNGHPVWYMKGVYLLDFYIFLHTADSADAWYWAITADETFTSERLVMARCNHRNQTNITEPSLCPQWEVEVAFDTDSSSFAAYDDLTVSAAMCNVTDEYLCITSQSSLSGLHGTYRQFNLNVPLWFRELDACDSTPGILRYDQGNSFMLIDSLDQWTVAQCTLNVTDSDAFNYSRDAFAPELCAPWSIVPDGLLSNDQLVRDDSLRIAMDKCDAYECVRDASAPPALCLSQNSVLHSFLEGTYIATGVTGDQLGSVEYRRQQALYDGAGDAYFVYLWFLAEIQDGGDAYNLWMLSAQNLSGAQGSPTEAITYYAYTACALRNLADCTSLWNFYWSVTGSAHADEQFTAVEGECVAAPTAAPFNYSAAQYAYVCVDVNDTQQFEDATTLDAEEFIGAYEIQFAAAANASASDVPYWRKRSNDLTDAAMYIYFDALFGHWLFGRELFESDAALMICMSMADARVPELCDTWYDMGDGGQVQGLFDFHSDACTYDDVLIGSCSAQQSWVTLWSSGTAISPSPLTISSSYALFAPYWYSLKATAVATFNYDGGGGEDDVCDPERPFTQHNVTGRVVLLYTSTVFQLPCDDYTQIYTAQRNGAVAVLLSADGSSVASLPGTLPALQKPQNASFTTSIPVRSISIWDAKEIVDAVQSGEEVLVELQCNDSVSFPLTLCASDVDFHVVGNYEYQSALRKNGHPVWLREGYSMFGAHSDAFLFLHDADEQSEWFWAITADSDMNDDTQIMATCSSSNDSQSIDDPSQCPQWLVYGGSSSADANASMTIATGACPATNHTFCMRSEQSSLGGLQGTFSLVTPSEPVWFRELDACDAHGGVLYFDDAERTFYLFDPMDAQVFAACSLGDDPFNAIPSEVYAALRMSPQDCVEWMTVRDGTLDTSAPELDASLSIDDGLACLQWPCYATMTAPPSLCLAQNSVMHSFLEGDYVATGAVGEAYGSAEYVRRDLLYYDAETPVHVYLFWYGELSERYPWWLLAAHNLSVAAQQNYSVVYGYSACSALNPAYCESWNFYWSGEQQVSGSWHWDSRFTLDDGECTTDGDEDDANNFVYGENFTYICVDFDVPDIDGEVDVDVPEFVDRFRGAYQISSLSDGGGGEIPFWTKPANEFISRETYIYYDAFYGYWQVDESLNTSASFICHSDTPYPQQCRPWYDEATKAVDAFMRIRVDDCGESDLLSLPPTIGHTGNVGLTVGVIVVIVVALLICIGAYVLFKRKAGNSSAASSGEYPHKESRVGAQSSSMATSSGKRKKKKSKRGHQQLAIDDDDDDDLEMGALNTGAKGAKGTSGGYDMSPLARDNANQATQDETRKESYDLDQSETNERLHDEHTDHVDNDIDDDEDGVLMNNH